MFTSQAGGEVARNGWRFAAVVRDAVQLVSTSS